MSEIDQEISELALDSAGARLRRAREAAGLTLADISSRTRIAERHLLSIEAGKFTALASRAYAVGFSRSYAREVGLDEHEIADAVRGEADSQEPLAARYQSSSFEPGDPARVPAARIAWIAGLSALAVVVAGLIFWRSFYAPAMPLPDIAADISASASPGNLAVASVVPPPSAQGPVVFTALDQGIWVRFYDAAGNQLLQKEMSLGETYTVPADANGPMIRTARPESLQIAIGGQIVAKLAERQMTIGDVPVSAAALLARDQAPAPLVPGAPGEASGVSAPAAPRIMRRDAPRSVQSPAVLRAAVGASPALPAAAPATLASPGPAASSQSSTVSQ